MPPPHLNKMTFVAEASKNPHTPKYVPHFGFPLFIRLRMLGKCVSDLDLFHTPHHSLTSFQKCETSPSFCELSVAGGPHHAVCPRPPPSTPRATPPEATSETNASTNQRAGQPPARAERRRSYALGPRSRVRYPTALRTVVLAVGDSSAMRVDCVDVGCYHNSCVED